MSLVEDQQLMPVENINQNFTFSSIPIPNMPDPKILGTGMEVILIILYSIIMVFGLLSNIAMIWVVMGKKEHRTAKNLYIVNLAISGISMCLICIPPTLMQCIYGGKWFLGVFACKLVPAVQGTNILVATGTITAIAVDRWFTITKTSTGTQELQQFPELNIPGFVPHSLCVERLPGPLKHCITFAILGMQYIMPIIILPIIHSKILMFLEENSGLSLDTRRKEREQKRNKRMTFILSCIAITFAVSWLPYWIFFIAPIFSDKLQISNIETFYLMLGLCHVVAMSSAISNPVLYGWLNTNLRKEFIKVFPGWCPFIGNRHPRSNTMDRTQAKPLQGGNNKTSKPLLQEDNNKTSKPLLQEDNSKTSKPRLNRREEDLKPPTVTVTKSTSDGE